MAVSKRTRYEVLKRDNYTCRYCKATDNPLTLDHVKPVALGGLDVPENLVAACRDCNAGKSSTIPDAETVKQVDEDAERWAHAIRAAAQKMVDDLPEPDVVRHHWFVHRWKSWDDDCGWLPDGWAKSLDYWLAGGLPERVVLDALVIAMGNRGVSHQNVFAYMGGICRKKLEVLQEDARRLLDEEASDGS